jgi:adenosine deaminase/adenosine deaminase CECR1
MSRLSGIATGFGLLIGSNLLMLPAAASHGTPAQRPVRPSEAAVSTWLENKRHRPPSQRAFVQRMPKGGDIHSHLSGAVYAEHDLQWAAADGYCVNPTSPALVKPSACGQDPKDFPASACCSGPTPMPPW